MKEYKIVSHVSADVAAVLPSLRRHARAMTGCQDVGDQYVQDVLDVILDDPAILTASSHMKIALYQTFFQMFEQQQQALCHGQKNQGTESSLTPRSRQTCQLRLIERFSFTEIAEIMAITEQDVADLLVAAQAEMRQGIKGQVTVIAGDESNAMDLQDIVGTMGHRVTIAVKGTQAAAFAVASRPDLILYDIHLADGARGINVVGDLLRTAENIPTIFITGAPERLLTGERHEPSFVISEPYVEEHIHAVVSQAMLFSANVRHG